MNLEIKKILELIKNNKFKEAIFSLDKLIKNDQNNIDYYHLRGISYLKLTKFDSAKNDFDKLLKLNLIFLMFIIILLYFIFQLVKMNLQ